MFQNASKNMTCVLFSIMHHCMAVFQVYADLFVDESYGRNCKCSTAHCELLLDTSEQVHGGVSILSMTTEHRQVEILMIKCSLISYLLLKFPHADPAMILAKNVWLQILSLPTFIMYAVSLQILCFVNLKFEHAKSFALPVESDKLYSLTIKSYRYLHECPIRVQAWGNRNQQS